MGELYDTVWDAFAAGEESRRAALTPAERDEEDRAAADRKAELAAMHTRIAAKARASNAAAREFLDPVIAALENASALDALGAHAAQQLRDAAVMGGSIVAGQVETVRRKDRRGFFDSTEWVKNPPVPCLATSSVENRRSGATVVVGVTDMDIIAVICPGYGQALKTRVLRAEREEQR